MLNEALVVLASASGSAVVGAMATDVWQITRSRVARLFGCGDVRRQAAIEAQLDDDAETLHRVDQGDKDRVRQELVPVWQRRFVRLLEENPDIEADLRDLVQQVEETVSPQRKTWTQTNVATNRSVVFAVQDGDQQVQYGTASPESTVHVSPDE